MQCVTGKLAHMRTYQHKPGVLVILVDGTALYSCVDCLFDTLQVLRGEGYTNIRVTTAAEHDKL